jgi:hypothetical protein
MLMFEGKERFFSDGKDAVGLLIKLCEEPIFTLLVL